MNSSYWNKFYSGLDGSILIDPSDFAFFVKERFMPVEHLIEVGCGNGRDFRLLARHAGSSSRALDASVAAIEFCKQCDPGGQYICGDLTDFGGWLKDFDNGSELLVYGRFFLHAVSPIQQVQFINQLSRLTCRRVVVALEYRVVDDESLKKVYGGHDRYYVDHDGLVSQLKRAGFFLEYEIVSRGLSVFKEEDPLVGRLIASMNLSSK